MSEEASLDVQRERARAWQRNEVKRRLAEADARGPGHEDVTEAQLDAVFDQYLGGAGDTEEQKPEQDR